MPWILEKKLIVLFLIKRNNYLLTNPQINLKFKEMKKIFNFLFFIYKIYNNLENVLNRKNIWNIEIFLNLLTKHLPKYLEIYLFEHSTL